MCSSCNSLQHQKKKIEDIKSNKMLVQKTDVLGCNMLNFASTEKGQERNFLTVALKNPVNLISSLLLIHFIRFFFPKHISSLTHEALPWI